MSAPPRLRITERDIAILHSLSTARFLTAQAIDENVVCMIAGSLATRPCHRTI
jgi:hypothetical protein